MKLAAGALGILALVGTVGVANGAWTKDTTWICLNLAAETALPPWIFAETDTRLVGLETKLLPAGAVVAFAGPVIGQAPAGWLFCDGAAVSRATYASLFAAIGTTAGDGDGTTTFNVPDYRGRFLRGTDLGEGRDPDALGRTAMNMGGVTGDAVNTVQGHAFAAHNHGGATGTMFMPSGGGAGKNLDYVQPTGGTCAAFSYTATATNTGCGSPLDQHKHAISSDGGSSETRPTNAAVNYLIRF